MSEADYAEAWTWVHWMLHAGPELRGLLCTYLADLRREEQPELLLPRLERALGDPVPAVLAHARTLVEER